MTESTNLFQLAEDNALPFEALSETESPEVSAANQKLKTVKTAEKTIAERTVLRRLNISGIKNGTR